MKEYADEQRVMVGNSKCNIEKHMQQQCTSPLIHPLAFSIHDFRIVQSINLCCCMRKVTISYCLGTQKSESTTDYWIMADYRVLSWSWRSGPGYDWCLCLTRDDHGSLSIFIAAKHQGSWLHIAQYVLCAAYLTAGETRLWVTFQRAFQWPWEMNRQSEGLFTFCKAQFMLIFMALLA